METSKPIWYNKPWIAKLWQKPFENGSEVLVNIATKPRNFSFEHMQSHNYLCL